MKLDRITSAGTGSQVALNRKDLLTLLPAPEHAFDNDTPLLTSFASPLSPFRFRHHPADLEEDDDAMDASMSAFACLIEATEAMGEVHAFCLQQFKAEAGSWREKIIKCQELDLKLMAWRRVSTFLLSRI